MAKIKHTKTELKAQNDALRRYQRFLPMLQLKKQQLQLEIASITSRIEAVARRESEQRAAADSWIALFSEPDVPDELAVLEAVDTDTGNIAGVAIPIYRGIQVNRAKLDLFATPSWYDDAQDMIAATLALAAEKRVLEEQRRRVMAELTTTSQRVNLFEKIKIPECRESIRIIRIHLGDEQTAGVARGKLAKRRGGEPGTDREDAA